MPPCDGASHGAVYRAFLESLNDLILADVGQIGNRIADRAARAGRFRGLPRYAGSAGAGLIEVGLDGVIQVASFHRVPARRCANGRPGEFHQPFTLPDVSPDPGGWRRHSNPIRAESIPQRNVARLRELGIEGSKAEGRELMESAR